jgi:beta-lactamase regulating signal transducer with metallopeptidase domain
MSDYLLQMALSNGFIALALALVALVVGAKSKRPHLAHLLWILVLVKLVTPPLVTVPVVAFPGQPGAAVAISGDLRTVPLAMNSRSLSTAAVAEMAQMPSIGTIVQRGKPWFIFAWLLGSAIVLVCSLSRVHRFNRFLAATSGVAPPSVQAAAERIAQRLDLNRMPKLTTTSAHISPVVWWTGGQVRVVIPSALIEQMDEKQLEWILAHELAHVKRGDYLVRWLEWLACVGFWWNPVVWWAQRNLRAAEEVCCDALVLSSLRPKPRSYANSLLMVAEYLAHPVIHPPAMASEINSGGFLERRIRMIVSDRPRQVQSRWLTICVLLCAMVIIPFGMANAQDQEAVEKRLGRAIEQGEITVRQAAAMMEVLEGWTKDDDEWEQDWDEENWDDDKGDWEEDWDEENWDDDKGEWEKDWDKQGWDKDKGEWEKDWDEQGWDKDKGEWEKDWDEQGWDKDEGEWEEDWDGDEEAYFDSVMKELKEAVEAGKLSEEEAREKWERFAHDGDDMEMHEIEYEEMAAHIIEAAESGEISEKDADEKLARLRKEFYNDDDGDYDENVNEEKYAREVEEIQEAVAKGKMSREAAHEKLEWLRAALASDEHGDGDHDGGEEHDDGAHDERD